MYAMDRTRKCRAAAVVLTLLFAACTVWGFCAGGGEVIECGFMNEPLPTIVMVVSFFAAVFSLFLCFLSFFILHDGLILSCELISQNKYNTDFSKMQLFLHTFLCI